MSNSVVGSAPSDLVSVSRGNNLAFVSLRQVDSVTHAGDRQDLEECIREGLVQNFAEHLSEDNWSQLTELELRF